MSLTSTDVTVFSSVTTAWQTTPQITAKASLPPRTVRYSLAKLVRIGLVRRQPASPAPYFSRHPEPPPHVLAEITAVATATGRPL